LPSLRPLDPLHSLFAAYRARMGDGRQACGSKRRWLDLGSQVPAAAGLFVQIPDVSPLTETDYAKEIEKLQDPTSLVITQQCKITPKDGADTAALFQDISQQDKKLARKLKPGELPIVKSASDTLPADTPVVVETAITRSGEKEYYRIVKCKDNPAVVGMFLLVKEVSSILDISPPGSQQPSEG
ncbi:MAG: hypothetical protein ACWGO1_02990, partial [Anaerolineales bacterium]